MHNMIKCSLVSVRTYYSCQTNSKLKRSRAFLMSSRLIEKFGTWLFSILGQSQSMAEPNKKILKHLHLEYILMFNCLFQKASKNCLSFRKSSQYKTRISPLLCSYFLLGNKHLHLQVRALRSSWQACSSPDPSSSLSCGWKIISNNCASD